MYLRFSGISKLFLHVAKYREEFLDSCQRNQVVYIMVVMNVLRKLYMDINGHYARKTISIFSLSFRDSKVDEQFKFLLKTWNGKREIVGTHIRKCSLQSSGVPRQELQIRGFGLSSAASLRLRSFCVICA